MFTASNSLSFIRAPLAFLFLQDNPTLRITAILLAMFTDSIDGYVARRNQTVSKFGTVLDPITDKFFVYFAITALFLEHRLETWELACMVTRDFFVYLYGAIQWSLGRWNNFVIRSIRWGKVVTALQFIVLIGLILNITFPWYIYTTFFALGFLAFLELFTPKPAQN
jgi:CDP-diacylglycerol--glycerol-3-phosphate 3-phosphatidyltransferase